MELKQHFATGQKRYRTINPCSFHLRRGSHLPKIKNYQTNPFQNRTFAPHIQRLTQLCPRSRSKKRTHFSRIVQIRHPQLSSFIPVRQSIRSAHNTPFVYAFVLAQTSLFQRPSRPIESNRARASLARRPAFRYRLRLNFNLIFSWHF